MQLKLHIFPYSHLEKFFLLLSVFPNHPIALKKYSDFVKILPK